jgi:hypothetical protein
VCLRNPADRLHSLYQMHFRARQTKQAFDEYLFSQNATWIKGNFYWPDLDNYYRRFDRGRIHVILFDDLKTQCKNVVRSLYEFLGVDASFVPDMTPQNTGGMPSNEVVYRLVVGSKDFLRKFGTPPVRLRIAWAKLRRKLLVQTEIDPGIRRKILEVCADDIFRTQQLIGRDLSMWLR